MAGSAKIKEHFDLDDANRQESLQRARLCAKLTKPWVLPPDGHESDHALPENFQSVGSRGITNMEGRLLLALWPPGVPWFQFKLSPEIEYAPDVDPGILNAIKELLFLRELTVQAVLESAALNDKSKKRRSGFRTRKRMALTQILVTGDVLEQLTDDYRIKTFRRDQYVTRRDSAGDVLYHIVRERIDPLTLTDGQLAIAELDKDKLADERVDKRMQDIYTRIEWQPRAKNWLIQQEVNGHIIVESEESVTPYFSTPFELAPGDHYGRGFVEQNVGDFRSTDELEERLLDFAAMASKFLVARDASSMVRDEDLEKPSGSIIEARVSGGHVQDIGMLRVDKAQDFNVVWTSIQHKTMELNKAMLMEAELQPRGDRVTALQISRIAAEIDGALGGLYAPVADEQQVPLLRRTVWQLERDNLLATLPDEAVTVDYMTGIAALGREVNMQRVLNLTQVIGQLGPEAMARINMGVLIDVLRRYGNIHEPGLIKSDEQLAQEQQAAAEAAVMQQAAGKAIDVAGNVAQQEMTPQGG